MNATAKPMSAMASVYTWLPPAHIEIVDRVRQAHPSVGRANPGRGRWWRPRACAQAETSSSALSMRTIRLFAVKRRYCRVAQVGKGRGRPRRPLPSVAATIT